MTIRFSLTGRIAATFLLCAAPLAAPPVRIGAPLVSVTADGGTGGNVPGLPGGTGPGGGQSPDDSTWT
ncbi:hypothetical protein Nocox_19905 [Nonomuraea coxensis DSM 45129]|uniref:Uncharacterized protein n=1 Tax=Nonomuraea coxensis DSM 45129 TaxID=1122611 RepID=A0ABX8U1G8_9ACTN|nr:hypothetical protein [Nonomuraea coxensis]QYC41590.1 hypothetical protein Nocox_19905 [Nonomuraea coxensis DSM 45129]